MWNGYHQNMNGYGGYYHSPMSTRHGIFKFFGIRKGSSGYQGSNMSFGKGYGGSYYTGYVHRRNSHQYGL